MQRRRVSAVDSQRLVERARTSSHQLHDANPLQPGWIITRLQRIEQSRELLSRSTGCELESRQRVDDQDDVGTS